MTFRENLAVLRERWVLVVLTVALAMGASAAVWALRPVQYTATLTLYVSAQTADSAQTAYQGGLLSQQRVKPYIELIRSVRVSEQVVADLRLPLTPEQVAAEIDATSTPDSVLDRRRGDRPGRPAGRGHRQRREHRVRPTRRRAGALRHPETRRRWRCASCARRPCRPNRRRRTCR
jgi:uncharacterized protein involved in exopolysaccharide biosynthesis